MHTVLVAYSSLRKILKDYDCAFKSRLQSSFMSIHLRCGVPTETLIGEMLEINRKKLLLLILKDTVETALDSIPSPYKDILYLRFLKGMTFQEISELQDISLRTAFRRFDKARDVFGAALAKLGLTERFCRALHERSGNRRGVLAPQRRKRTSPRKASATDERENGKRAALSLRVIFLRGRNYA